MDSSNQARKNVPQTEQSQERKAHLPFWKSGSGHFGKTLGQSSRLLLSSCREFVLSWLDTVPVKKGSVFTIADLGANDGYASMLLIESMIEHLRKTHGDDLPIQIIYEDQEKNDFNSLFNRLCDSTSYIHKFRNVYPMATNVNFYKQFVPDGTCDVILSTYANHWMENVNTTFKDSIFDLTATKEERARLSVEGERDWTKLLLHRARELKPGGIFMPMNCSSQEEGTPEASLGEGEQKTAELPIKWKSDLHADLDASWKELKEKNIITQEEYKQCRFTFISRTAQECQAPFERESSAVRQAGLTLVYFDQLLDTRAEKVEWRENLKKGMNKADCKARFADATVKSHKVWGYTTFHYALSDMRTEEEKAAILDELYKMFQAQVMTKDPETYQCETLISRLVVRKSLDTV